MSPELAEEGPRHPRRQRLRRDGQDGPRCHPHDMALQIQEAAPGVTAVESTTLFRTQRVQILSSCAV